LPIRLPAAVLVLLVTTPGLLDDLPDKVSPLKGD
jgi:hypothetical protein